MKQEPGRVIVMSAARLGDTLPDLLQRTFEHAIEIAASTDLQPPFTIDLASADERRVLAMTMVQDKEGWHTYIESGDFDAREGMPLPWFLTLADLTGRRITIRLELDSLRSQIN